MAKEIVISSDSHVFEPPDLWAKRIDLRFRDRAPHIRRVGDKDDLMVEGDQRLAGIGLILGAGTRFEAPEKISHEGRLEDVHIGAFEPDEHIKDMRIDGVSGEVLYPSLGLFLFKVADSELLSAIFRAYNDWLTEFCSSYPSQLKGIAMINLDDVQDGIRELERTAALGMVGAMISEYPAESRRYDSPEYEPFWAASQDLEMPLSLHTATRRDGRSRGAGATSVRVASERANKVFWRATSLCDMIFAGVFERYPRLKVAVVEFELTWAAHLLGTMDYTYVERQEEASYRFKGNLLPSDFFHNNVYLGFQEDPVGIGLRNVIGVDSLMWGSDYPHAESTFPRSLEILDKILEGVPKEERAKIVGGNAARLYNFELDNLP
jgi:predicted TIM-barrel fold metal-dependent hydrolase